jgi:hypothetical protein
VTAGPGGAVSCTAALVKGPNTLLVSVVDVAGNSTSATIDVTRTGTPTSLSFQPAMITLAAGQQAVLYVEDDFGAVPASVTFTSSDDNVAEMSADVNGLVLARRTSSRRCATAAPADP